MALGWVELYVELLADIPGCALGKRLKRTSVRRYGSRKWPNCARQTRRWPSPPISASCHQPWSTTCAARRSYWVTCSSARGSWSQASGESWPMRSMRQGGLGCKHPHSLGIEILHFITNRYRLSKEGQYGTIPGDECDYKSIIGWLVHFCR